MAPIAVLVGLVTSNELLLTVAIVTWILMAIAYLPTLKLYRLSHGWSLSLPLIAFLYNLMALDSAWRYWRGQGGAWKGRVYSQQ
jgi:hypothetical protein